MHEIAVFEGYVKRWLVMLLSRVNTAIFRVTWINTVCWKCCKQDILWITVKIRGQKCSQIKFAESEPLQISLHATPWWLPHLYSRLNYHMCIRWLEHQLWTVTQSIICAPKWTVSKGMPWISDRSGAGQGSKTNCNNFYSPLPLPPLQAPPLYWICSLSPWSLLQAHQRHASQPVLPASSEWDLLGQGHWAVLRTGADHAGQWDSGGGHTHGEMGTPSCLMCLGITF